MEEPNVGEVSIVTPADCGNSPKRVFLRDFLISMTVNDLSFIEKHLSDSFCWTEAGRNRRETKSGFIEMVEQQGRVVELGIRGIITHGKEAAVNGIQKFADGRQTNFCHTIEFVSAGKKQIKAITSYII
ncbi:hypothetical protein LCM10_05475 [Rossellomorea aquimaris]|uniref:hypothetical protein n=1 Tax=Rossellomorea aquimaris TaxID=189382 RepID=UPI001CD692E9|nr:hypothetical protein [Rossellomorea aquimaris]MCA1054428.1 hypothetical protein [Rossellomorea aquimaris]